MSFLSDLLAAIRGGGSNAAAPAAARKPASRAALLSSARAMAGGRLSSDGGTSELSATLALLAPEDHETNWHTLDLDNDTLSTLSPDELIRMLADLSPDISRALWDFIRLCNPGWEYEVKAGNAETEDAAGTAAVKALLARLKELYGSVDVPLNRLFLGAFLRGAFCGELVLEMNGQTFSDLATPDPGGLRFKAIKDPVRGQIWQPGQWQAGKFVAFDRPTFRYVPIDPFPGSPYGRPLANPALFTAIFLIGLLHDLRRVISQQGYPRHDISVNMEKLAAAMPADLEGDPSKIQGWANGIIDEVKAVYAALEPDDAYIHTDVITINRPVGTVNAESLGAVEGIIKSLERMAIRGLKTMPLLMGVNEATSETHANRQWEVHVAGIKSLQHLAESLLEYLFGLALRAQGLQATVTWRFAELRASEMLRDAQTETMLISNARAKYDAGWTSQDEAAEAVTGHKADVPEPRVATDGSPGGGLAGVNADPGSQRHVQRIGRPVRSGGHGEGCECGEEERGARGEAGSRIKVIPDGAGEPLPPIPDEVTISDADIERAINAWDTVMGEEYAGLLEASVINQQYWNTEASELAMPLQGLRAGEGIRMYGDESPWVWDDRVQRYRNTSTGRFLGAKQMVDLRDEFVEAQKAAAHELADQVVAGDISLQRWTLDMRDLIKTNFIDEYVMAHGGRSNMTPRDWGIIGHMCRDQYSFLEGFAKDIDAGKLSPAQIRARASLYMNAATHAFERGASEVRGIPRLPAYPADGSSLCGVNDRCTWEYEETDTEWHVTWTLHPAEHCQSCLDRAQMWKPLVVAKE